MPFAHTVHDVRLVQPGACRVVPKWSPARRPDPYHTVSDYAARLCWAAPTTWVCRVPNSAGWRRSCTPRPGNWSNAATRAIVQADTQIGHAGRQAHEAIAQPAGTT
jgi:hypothetical protein